MAKRKKSTLPDAQKFAQLLLYQATGGSMGKAPENQSQENIATFGEKKALLDTLLRVVEMERKDLVENEELSAFDIIKKEMRHGGGTGRSRRDSWGESESGSDEAGISEENA